MGVNYLYFILDNPQVAILFGLFVGPLPMDSRSVSYNTVLGNFLLSRPLNQKISRTRVHTQTPRLKYSALVVLYGVRVL